MNKNDINILDVISREAGLPNRDNKVCCPIHGEKTASLQIYPKTNSWFCYGCNKGGDSIHFIREVKNYSYIEACNYLEIDLDEKTQELENNKDKIRKAALSYYKGYECKEIYNYTDLEGKIIYYKVKLQDKNGKKITPYYHIENGKVIAKRGTDEVPYNYFKLVNALKNSKEVFIVEGEKDVNTLSMLGYTGTSLKNIKDDFDFSIFKDSNVYFIADTGKAGTEYKNKIFKLLKNFVKSFKIIELTAIEKLGDNKDLTDWIESGKTDYDLYRCMFHSWDWKISKLWRYVNIKYGKEGEIISVTPKKHWRNLELILEREGIELKYNELTREIVPFGNLDSIRNSLLIDIQSLATLENFKISKDEARDFISKIAEQNKYNRFKEILIENRNQDHSIIDEVFECLIINEEEQKQFLSLYRRLFKKFYINAAKQVFNTLEAGYKTQGVLVLQGEQGTGKTTFFSKIMPKGKDFFIEGKQLKPHDKDNVMQITKYPVVELGELDGTLKKDLETLKAFITSDVDEYRKPYQALEEKYPRTTSFVGTVNKKDFLKDETGDRRYWIIPIEGVDLEKLSNIDVNKFWGALYDLYITGQYKEGLSREELAEVRRLNKGFTAENDILLAINDAFNFDEDKKFWKVYTLTNLKDVLDTREMKSVKNTLMRMGYKYQAHRDGNKVRKGFKLPGNRWNANTML